MKKQIPLPNGKSIEIEYNKSVYDPNYTNFQDVIGLADMCIKEIKPSRVVDVGCGSGVLGLGIKKLHPFLDVYCSDLDTDAVKMTKSNAKANGLLITTVQADLIPGMLFFPLVIANLPTYDSKQLREDEAHGPEITVKSSNDDGLSLYKELLNKLGVGSFLICEVQEKRQAEFEKILEEAKVYQVVARAKMAYAIFKRPVPVYSDSSILTT